MDVVNACRVCGKGNKIVAKGMCGNCYQKMRKKNHITLKFENRDSTLFERLTGMAEMNRRTIENEVMIILEIALKKGAEK